MAEVSLSDFIAHSVQRLQEKSEALSKQIFEQLNDPAWNINAEERLIEWTDASSGKVVLAYRCIPIGSFNFAKSTWLWSWANHNVPNHKELITEISALPKLFPDVPQFFTAKEFEVPESFAIEVTAALVELYDAVSFYRFTTDDDKQACYFYLKDI